MISNDAKNLLYVEPKNTAQNPVIDELTRQMAAAWRAAKKDPDGWRGVHQCTGSGCGVASTNHDYHVGGLQTNSLCVHYLAFHREEIPETELAKVRALPFDGVEPTEDELKAPGYVPERQRVTRG